MHSWGWELPVSGMPPPWTPWPRVKVPLEILEHLPPKPESAYFLLCAFTYTSDFTGGLSPTTSLKKELAYSSS